MTLTRTSLANTKLSSQPQRWQPITLPSWSGLAIIRNLLSSRQQVLPYLNCCRSQHQIATLLVYWPWSLVCSQVEAKFTTRGITTNSSTIYLPSSRFYKSTDIEVITFKYLTSCGSMISRRGVVVHPCMWNLEAMPILIIFETNYQSNQSVFEWIFF